MDHYAQRRVNEQESTNSTEVITVSVDRDSVCAGDDTEPHLTSFTVPASTTLSEFLQLIKSAHYLASIQGGNATWLIDCIVQEEKRCIGVAAQQWATAKLLIAPNTRLVELSSGSELSLYFRYWAQADPPAVFASLHSNQALPSR